MKTIIVIYGLPKSGKTTLAKMLSRILNGRCLWLDDGRVQQTLNQDISWNHKSQVEGARRLGCVASMALDNASISYVVADFVNPTDLTYSTFLSSAKAKRLPSCENHCVYTVLMNTSGQMTREEFRLQSGMQFEDHESMVRRPNLTVVGRLDARGMEEICHQIIAATKMTGVDPDESVPRRRKDDYIKEEHDVNV